MTEKIGYAIAIIFVSAAWLFMAHQANECRDSGGTIVRGVFALECINGEAKELE
jgi:hypothetical protein